MRGELRRGEGGTMDIGRRLNRVMRWLQLPGSSEIPCPHCLARIGRIENVCPNCRRVLRFEGVAELRARHDKGSAR